MASTNLFGEQQTTTGRIVSHCPEAVKHRLTETDVYDSNGKPRHEILREHMRLEGRLTEEAALKIISQGDYYTNCIMMTNVKLTTKL